MGKRMTFTVNEPTDRDLSSSFAKAKRSFLMQAEQKFADEMEAAARWVKEGGVGTRKMEIFLEVGEITIERTDDGQEG